MEENRGAYAIGFVVFVIFLVIMLWAFNMANNLTTGTAFGSFLTGLLWDKFGASLPFLLSSAISLVVAVAFLFARNGNK